MKFLLISFIFLFFVGFLWGGEQKNTLFIYAGPGVSCESLKQTLATFEKLLKSYQIEKITPEQVIKDNWEERAALFVLPGGADLPYVRSLSGKGNERIRRFVEEGGSFLGICAGSYYAGNFVNFAEGTDLEVKGPRELSFFPGTVEGPVLATYEYNSSSGARAATIHWTSEDEDVTVFYNGGGYFVEASGLNDVTILAHYEMGMDYPAIVECSCGKGVAILSGVHFEYHPQLLDSEDSYLKNIIPVLQQEDEKRLHFLNYLLGRLKVTSHEMIR